MICAADVWCDVAMAFNDCLPSVWNVVSPALSALSSFSPGLGFTLSDSLCNAQICASKVSYCCGWIPPAWFSVDVSSVGAVADDFLFLYHMTRTIGPAAAMAAQPHIGIPAIFLVKPEPPPSLGGVCIGGVGSAIRRTLH